MQFKKKNFKTITFFLSPLSAVVVLAFVLCWLPFHVGRYLFSKSSEANSPFISQISEYCNLVSFVLFYLSAAINPILYNIMSKKYRSAACKLFGVRRAHGRSVQSIVNAESFSVCNEYSWSTWHRKRRLETCTFQHRLKRRKKTEREWKGLSTLTS